MSKYDSEAIGYYYRLPYEFPKSYPVLPKQDLEDIGYKISESEALNSTFVHYGGTTEAELPPSPPAGLVVILRNESTDNTALFVATVDGSIFGTRLAKHLVPNGGTAVIMFDGESWQIVDEYGVAPVYMGLKTEAVFATVSLTSNESGQGNYVTDFSGSETVAGGNLSLSFSNASGQIWILADPKPVNNVLSLGGEFLDRQGLTDDGLRVFEEFPNLDTLNLAHAIVPTLEYVDYFPRNFKRTLSTYAINGFHNVDQSAGLNVSGLTFAVRDFSLSDCEFLAISSSGGDQFSTLLNLTISNPCSGNWDITLRNFYSLRSLSIDDVVNNYSVNQAGDNRELRYLRVSGNVNSFNLQFGGLDHSQWFHEILVNTTFGGSPIDYNPALVGQFNLYRLDFRDCQLTQPIVDAILRDMWLSIPFIRTQTVTATKNILLDGDNSPPSGDIGTAGTGMWYAEQIRNGVSPFGNPYGEGMTFPDWTVLTA